MNTLRDRLIEAGLIGPDADPSLPPMRLVEAVCPRCGYAQAHLLPAHKSPRCIEPTCDAELEPS